MRIVTLALRRARREPGPTLSSVAILAVGIAANVVVFSAVDRLVLDPLPLPESDRIVAVGAEMPGAGRPFGTFEVLSGPEIAGIVADTRGLEAWLPFDLNSVALRGDEYPTRLFGAFVWGDPLPLLGVEPALGRGPTADEIARGAPVVLLSHGTWSGEFGGDPTAVGRTAELDGVPHTVVGVLPPFAGVYGVDVWMPAPESLATLPLDRRQFNLLARLPEGGTMEGAAAGLTATAARLQPGFLGESAAYEGWRLAPVAFARGSAFGYADEATLTLGAAVLVLLLIGVNLGTLALVRGIRARTRTATCLTLGGGRGVVVADALCDALVVGVPGGVAGLAAAWAALTVLASRLPGVLQPQGPPLSVGPGGVAFAAAATVASTGLLLAAALAGRARTSPGDALSGGRGAAGSRGLRRAQRILASAQVALGLTLASGAAGVALAVARTLAEPPGFAADELVSMRVSLPAPGYTGDAVPAFFETLLDRLGGLPGVRQASMATQVAPNTLFSANVEVDGVEDPDPPLRLHHTVVGDGYFGALGLELIAGRAPDRRDRFGGPAAVVVNQAAARRLFGDQPAPGRPIRVRGTNFDSGWGEVVGVVRDIPNRGPGAPPAPEVFTAHRQAGERYRQMFLVVRATDDPSALVPAIRAEVGRLDPAQPVYAIGTPRGALDQQVAPRRAAAGVLLALAAGAVGLAGLGLHAVLSYGAATRRRELAVRASLGADPGRLRGHLIRDAAATTLLGLAAGTALTAWLGGALRAVLGDGARPGLGVVGAAALVLVATAAVASVRPARRAGRTPPADVLRESA